MVSGKLPNATPLGHRKQASLLGFFKKTPSTENFIENNGLSCPSSARTTANFETSSNGPLSSPSHETPTTGRVVATYMHPTREDDKENDETVGRVPKRRKIQMEDSDDEFGPLDVEESERISSAKLAAGRSAARTPGAARISPRSPPRFALDLSNSKLSSFAASNLDSFSLETSSDILRPSSQSTSTPALNRESSSKILTVIPKTRSERLIENEGGKLWLLPANLKDADGLRPDHTLYDPRTLHIPREAFAKMTPFEQQFWEIKSKNWDSVCFFQKGKFYELYEDDAVLGHQLFDLKLTSRGMRMVGVPDYTFDHWASQFIAQGHRVARVDQKESILAKEMRDRVEKGAGKAGSKDKLVRRELTQVLTQGTLVDEKMLQSDMSMFCMAIKEKCDSDFDAPEFGIAFVDTATGIFHFTSIQDDLARTKFDTLLSQIRPRELILEKGRLSPKSLRTLKNAVASNTMWNQIKPELEFWDEDITVQETLSADYFAAPGIENWPRVLRDVSDSPLVISAFGGLLWYLRNLKIDKDICSLGNFNIYDPIRTSASLVLDGQTLVNLEVFANTGDGGPEGTLFRLVCKCCTPFGKRLFRTWVCHPLQRAKDICDRLDAIDWLNNCIEAKQVLRDGLGRLPDLERLISRIHAGRCKTRDFIKVLEGFERILGTLKELRPEIDQSNTMLKQVVCELPDFSEKMLDWRRSFDWQKASEDGLIVPEEGVDSDFDESQLQIQRLTEDFVPLLEEYRKTLKSSKIVYKDVGNSKEIYQIEVPAELKVPRDWQRLSSTKAVVRYWSPKVKALVRELQEAQETHKQIVDAMEGRFFKRFDLDYQCWLTIVKAIATIDCLYSLACSSQSIGEPRCRPVFVESDRSVLEFEDLRHPCMELDSTIDFVPNDLTLGGEHPKMALLTGPNMAGKSTLLRSTCVGVILAQLGHYVPARSARLTPADQIHCRTGGAKDNIAASQSTFMVELSETASILASATDRSIVILDELGRGTSTYDGLAIAMAVLHQLCNFTGCLGIFSTHYSSLADEFQRYPEVVMKNMSYLLEDRKVTFLYKLVNGICSHSHGMNVAEMAGVPKSVIDAAVVASRSFDERARSQRSGDRSEAAVPLGLLSDFAWLAKLADTPATGGDSIDEHQLQMVRRLAKTIPS